MLTASGSAGNCLHCRLDGLSEWAYLQCGMADNRFAVRELAREIANVLMSSRAASDFEIFSMAPGMA